MLFYFAGFILMTWQASEMSKNISLYSNWIVESPGKTVAIQCSFPREESQFPAMSCYKEREDKLLYKIYDCTIGAKSEGKYSCSTDKQTYYALVISNVSRNDSGIYHCFTPKPGSYEICNTTQLIITSFSRQSLSVLAPSIGEDAQMKHSIPLLCLFWDANPAWDSISWNFAGETSQDEYINPTYRQEFFNIWSLKMISLARWINGTSFSCSNPNRNMTTEVIKKGASANTGQCNLFLYFGVPCILLLFSATLCLVFRKHPAQGTVQESTNQILMRNIYQADYSEFSCRN
ncbi:uncharacterized protein PHA67_014404 isoform 1-T1 [Liasis olivaceus]